MNLETAWAWNMDLFHLINAGDMPARLGLVRFVAQDTPWLVAVGLAGWWLVGGPLRRRAIMVAAVALALGMAVNFAITSTTYVARPFEAGIGQTWLAHGLETSFPSDHATLLLSIGLALVIAPGLRLAGAAITAIGLATAWARVYLGVHFPLDMMGSAVIALIAAVAAKRLGAVLDARLFAPVEQLYGKIVATVRRQPLM